MTTENWPHFMDVLNGRMDALKQGHPDVMSAFHTLDSCATKDGALSGKAKELIALAIAITVRCDGCLAYHAKACAKKGATREEIVEAIGVAVLMGGGPSVIYGSEALEAFDALGAA